MSEEMFSDYLDDLVSLHFDRIKRLIDQIPITCDVLDTHDSLLDALEFIVEKNRQDIEEAFDLMGREIGRVKFTRPAGYTIHHVPGSFISVEIDPAKRDQALSAV